MACMVSSASSRLARSCSSSKVSADFAMASRSIRIFIFQVQPDQYPFGIRHVANELPQRWRKLFDQSRRRNDLFAFDQYRLLVNVDHFEVVAVFQAALADLLYIGDRANGFGGCPGNIQAEDIFFTFGFGWRHKLTFGRRGTQVQSDQYPVRVR